MKRIQLLFPFLNILFFFLACNNHAEKDTPNDHGKANKHMHQTSIEELINRFEDTARVEWQKPDLVIEKFGGVKEKIIADIGAGSGYFTFKLAEKGAKVIALDVEEQFLDHIRKQNTNYKEGSITTQLIPFNDPQLENSSIDGAIIVNTYHHIADRIDYFGKVLNGIKPGGKLLVVDFKKEDAVVGPPKDMRIEGFEVIKELQQAGFTKVIIDTKSLPYQYIITAKRAEETDGTKQ